MKRERLELADGDFIDIDFYEKNGRPTLLLLHGLEGSIDSPYIRGMIDSAAEQDWQIVVMHFRGCSGEPNRLLRSYHSGASDDLAEVLSLLKKREIIVDYLVGYSLGGNVLLKWLGEQADKTSIKAAVAVSVPLMLDICAVEISQGFSKLYEFALLRTLRQKVRNKIDQFGHSFMQTKSEDFPDKKSVAQLTTFRRFDHQFTAPAHGFKDVDDYYQQASSRQFVPFIKVPTLIIQSKDDPFMNETVLPDLNSLPESVFLEANDNGGHVGFVQGQWPWSAEYYLEKRIPQFLKQW
jgi:predicted alpha/beta-fold hydrolase